MTKYTNGNGKSIMICDQCHNDLSQGDNVYVLTLNRVEDGYTTRHFDKRATLLCLECADTITQVLTTLGTRYADRFTLHQTI